MKLSGSYFKRLDGFARWLFGRRNDLGEGAAHGSAKQPQEPRTLNENSASIDMELSLNNLRPIKTEGGSGKSRYIRMTNRDAHQAQNCTVCLDKVANAVLMDCGHGAICFDCGLVLLNTTCECHLCRQPIVQVVKVDVKFCNEELLKVVDAVDLFSISKYRPRRASLKVEEN